MTQPTGYSFVMRGCVFEGFFSLKYMATMSSMAELEDQVKAVNTQVAYGRREPTVGQKLWLRMSSSIFNYLAWL